MSPIIEITPSICSASRMSSGRWSLISAYVRKPRSLPSTISVFRRRLRASTSAGVSSRGAMSACLPFLPLLAARPRRACRRASRRSRWRSACAPAWRPAARARPASAAGAGLGRRARASAAGLRRGDRLAVGAAWRGGGLRAPWPGAFATGLAAGFAAGLAAGLRDRPWRQRLGARACRFARGLAGRRLRLGGGLPLPAAGFALAAAFAPWAAPSWRRALAPARGFLPAGLAPRPPAWRPRCLPRRGGRRCRDLALVFGLDLRAGCVGFLAMVILEFTIGSRGRSGRRRARRGASPAFVEVGAGAGKPQIISRAALFGRPAGRRRPAARPLGHALPDVLELLHALGSPRAPRRPSLRRRGRACRSAAPAATSGRARRAPRPRPPVVRQVRGPRRSRAPTASTASCARAGEVPARTPAVVRSPSASAQQRHQRGRASRPPGVRLVGPREGRAPWRAPA